MTLQALREKIGDRAFFTVMRRWYAEHKYGNVSTPEFVALAQQVSRQNLGPFFKAWLYTPGKPAFLPDDGAAAAARAAARTGGRR
jgi:aminopeptidase N